MRILCGLILLPLVALPAQSQTLTSLSDCDNAIVADPARAREAAARWITEGGGGQARLCEAFALDATGATGTAAIRFTEIAQDPNIALSAPQRAAAFLEAARLWEDVGQLTLARETLEAAQSLDPNGDIPLHIARIALALRDGETARAMLAYLGEAAPPLLRAEIAILSKEAGKALTILQSVEGELADLLRAEALILAGDRDAALALLAAMDPQDQAVAERRRRLLAHLTQQASETGPPPGPPAQGPDAAEADPASDDATSAEDAPRPRIRPR